MYLSKVTKYLYFVTFHHWVWCRWTGLDKRNAGK